jgi:hypothetical protein
MAFTGSFDVDIYLLTDFFAKDNIVRLYQTNWYSKNIITKNNKYQIIKKYKNENLITSILKCQRMKNKTEEKIIKIEFIETYNKQYKCARNSYYWNDNILRWLLNNSDKNLYKHDAKLYFLDATVEGCLIFMKYLWRTYNIDIVELSNTTYAYNNLMECVCRHEPNLHILKWFWEITNKKINIRVNDDYLFKYASRRFAANKNYMDVLVWLCEVVPNYKK